MLVKEVKKVEALEKDVKNHEKELHKKREAFDAAKKELNRKIKVIVEFEKDETQENKMQSSFMKNSSKSITLNDLNISKANKHK